MKDQARGSKTSQKLGVNLNVIEAMHEGLLEAGGPPLNSQDPEVRALVLNEQHPPSSRKSRIGIAPPKSLDYLDSPE